MEDLGPPDGWADVKGIRGDLDPAGLGAVCDLPDEFAYGEWSAALQTVLGQRPLGRARTFHYRELARIAGLISQTRRGQYRRTATASQFCRAAPSERLSMLGKLINANPEVGRVVKELFRSDGLPKPIVVYQQGRSIILLTAVGLRTLDDLPARVVGGLLRLLVRTSAAQEVLVTIDLERREISDQLVQNATTGKLVNLVARPEAVRADVKAVALAVGRRGPNFIVASVPAMLRECLSQSLNIESFRDRLVEWWKEDPSSIHLVELSQAVSLFGVPRVYRRDIRETALESYVRVGARLYSHVYLTEAALGERVEAPSR